MAWKELAGENLIELFDNFGELLESSIDTIPLPKAKKTLLRSEDIKVVLEYLKNPTKTGVWRLGANWLTDSGISQHIWQDFSPKLQKKGKEIVLESEGRSIRISPEKIVEFKSAIFHQVSFLLNLFMYMQVNESKSAEEWQLNDATYRTIINNVDLEKLKEAFSDAYGYFKDNVYYQGFDPIIKPHAPYLTKNGVLYTLDTAQVKDLVSYVSLHPDSLRELATFLSKVGKIADWRVMPVFSPEEEVFSPYFLFARLAYPNVINDSRLHPLFTKAFSEYEAQRFESSTSTLGLIGEDFLTQIYETLFRDPVPKGQTMGQLFDLVQSKTNKMFQKEPLQPPDIDSMYKAVNEQIARTETDSVPTTDDALKLLRQVITLIKEERTYGRELARESQKQTSVISVFPSRIKDNINELIRFRNAASHKSRVPLSDFEALRTLYCLISLVMWWHTELNIIDWNDDSKTIIKKLIERSVATNT